MRGNFRYGRYQDVEKEALRGCSIIHCAINVTGSIDVGHVLCH